MFQQCFAYETTICFVLLLLDGNQGCEYWILLDVLTLAIKLYVQLAKENLELQEKIDVTQELDMCMKFK
jgi:hypothetical protein